MSKSSVKIFLIKNFGLISFFSSSSLTNTSCNLLSLLIFFLLNTPFLFAQTPTVTNVMFTQRTDGSHIVDIYYDVNNAGGGAMSVTIEVSDDNGVTWDFPCVMVTGDVGAGVTSGTGKHIVWDFAAEHPQTFGDQFRVKIIAEAGGGGMGIPCPGLPTITDPRDGKVYNTVLIGNQCWLKENMNIGTRIDGSLNQTSGNGIEKYCYDNLESYCDTYGGLYQWNEAMQYTTTPGAQGICPPGWHIPTELEFKTLEVAVNFNGNALKREDQGTGAGQGTNTSGFSALLSGYRTGILSFWGLGLYNIIWSSTVHYYTSAITLYLEYDTSLFRWGNLEKNRGFTVRCVIDN